MCSEYYCLIRTNFKMEVILWRAGDIGIDEKMASEEIDRFITDPSRRDVGGKTDSHLLFCLCWAPTP